MDLSCEYDAPKFVDFDSINVEDHALVEKYFDIDHECKSNTDLQFDTIITEYDATLENKCITQFQVPKIIFTHPTEDEKDASIGENKKKTKRSNIFESWGSKKRHEKNRVISTSKKISRDISDKRALTKTITKTTIENSEQISVTTSTRRLSNGKVGVVSSKISKTSRRSSLGTSNKKEKKSSSNSFGNCFKKVLQAQSSKDKTTNKPLKANVMSSFKLNKMIKSYQDKKDSKSKESPNVSDLKRVKHRSSDIFSRLTRDSSVGAKNHDKPTSTYVPMAEMIMKIENTTPDRYRTLPNRGRSQNSRPSLPRSRSNSSVPRSTVCKSPKLLTKEKSRQCCHTRSSHETLPSALSKTKKPQRKVCSSESVDRVQNHASCPSAQKAKTITKIQPFSFDCKIAESEAKKAIKIKEILEKENKDREFKATSAPNFHKPINLPIREFICPTTVEPFNLDVESRVEARIKKREENIKLEEKKQKELSKFKARPAKTERTFAPVPSNKPSVEVVAFEMHSDRRAHEREAFELRKKEKELEMQELEQKLEEQRKREEKEQVRKLRQEAVHKSNPIPAYRIYKVQPSTKMLTAGRSPNFRTKTRSLSKEE